MKKILTIMLLAACTALSAQKYQQNINFQQATIMQGYTQVRDTCLYIRNGSDSLSISTHGDTTFFNSTAGNIVFNPPIAGTNYFMRYGNSLYPIDSTFGLRFGFNYTNDTSNTIVDSFTERYVFGGTYMQYQYDSLGRPCMISNGTEIPGGGDLFYFPHVSMFLGWPLGGLGGLVSVEDPHYADTSDARHLLFTGGIRDNGGQYHMDFNADSIHPWIRTQTEEEGSRMEYFFERDNLVFSPYAGDGWALPVHRGTDGSYLMSNGDTAVWQPFTYYNLDSASIYALTPSTGQAYYCTDCTPNDNSAGGVVVTYNGSLWRRGW